MLARVLAMTLCLSVTSRCSIETAERIGLVFGTVASPDPSYTVLWGLKEIQVALKIRVLPL